MRRRWGWGWRGLGWGEGGGGGEVEKEGEEGHTIVCMAPAAFNAPDGIIISALIIEKS